ncbi:right-handed parallel beta-helix repeat-containing protein [Micromonospora sp. WMMA1363]|uniref:right-handed parallel beta-helix repeat-containing protein n=1 Tax=Micromonospora sp. WMMA1363 TaxID=3053985 RepID=UPI00259CB89F|nr:right-handed parallel beta-helix repeat-containing protein [Micromonospora sp. WMMA1363]MDM4723075.1 right-handed parallel beta-helix repeat-containing protein [Micromonospora sp. WMMA1363]
MEHTPEANRPPAPRKRSRRWRLAAALTVVTSASLVGGSLGSAAASPVPQPGRSDPLVDGVRRPAVVEDARGIRVDDPHDRGGERRRGAILPELMPVPGGVPDLESRLGAVPDLARVPGPRVEVNGEGRPVPCDVGQLINEISLANAAGEGILVLAPDCTYTLTDGQDGNGLPPITGRLTFIGRNSTIVRAAVTEKFRIFTVEGGGVLNLRQLTVTGGDTDTDGGGILVRDRGTATLVDTTVTNNTAEAFGGGVASYGVTTVFRSTFSDNRANLGGGLANHGTTTVASSTVENNSTRNGGGGAYSEGRFVMDRSRVTGNFADAAVGFGFGGGIFSFRDSATVVSNSVIANNVSANAGGGIGSLFDLSTTISNTMITGNRAGNGGGMYAETRLTMTSTTVADNIAVVGGGLDIIGIETSVDILDSVIEENRATERSGGGFRNLSGVVNVGNTLIDENQTAFDGGGIANGNFGVVTLTDTTVTENTAPGDARDGGIISFSGTVTVDAGTQIFNNRPRNCFNVPGCFN